MHSKIYIGTAAWTIPPGSRNYFPEEGTHLQRYAQRLNAVEINTCFYREHKPETYLKWSQSVPESFRFSAKLLRYFTQEKRLKETGARLKEVLDGMLFLGEKWGVLLVQLPPRLEFQARDAEKFISALRRFYAGHIVWEPRHKSWITDPALDLLSAFDISKALADPDPCFLSRKKREKVEKIIYYRLHGTPQIYRSSYSSLAIERVADRSNEAAEQGKTVYCLFDNTALGHATGNALDLASKVK